MIKLYARGEIKISMVREHINEITGRSSFGFDYWIEGVEGVGVFHSQRDFRHLEGQPVCFQFEFDDCVAGGRLRLVDVLLKQPVLF